MQCKQCKNNIDNKQFCSSSCAMKYNNRSRLGKTLRNKILCARCQQTITSSTYFKTYCDSCSKDYVNRRYDIININDKFNNLIVVDKPYKKDIITKGGKQQRLQYVKCQCICGNTKDLLVSNLIQNKQIGCGCQSSIKSTTENFIKRAKDIHGDKYDYSKSNYINNYEWITITCKTHGDFQARPYEHLRGSDCKRCILQNQSSKQANKWLDSLNLPNLIREYKIPNTNYYADGFDPNTNTIYEFNGMFYHGHPSKYNSEDIHPIKNIKYGELYKQTIKKQIELENLGYKIISVWG